MADALAKAKGKGKGKVVAALMALKGKGKGKAKEEESDDHDKPGKPDRSKTRDYSTEHNAPATKKTKGVKDDRKEKVEEKATKMKKRKSIEQLPDAEVASKKASKKKKPVEEQEPQEAEPEQADESEEMEVSKPGKKKANTKNEDKPVGKKAKRLTDAVGLEEPCDETLEDQTGPQEETQEDTPEGKRKKPKKMVGLVSREGSSVRLRSKTSLDSLPDPDAENTTPPRKTQKFASPSASTPTSTTASSEPKKFLVFQHGFELCLSNWLSVRF